MLRWSSSRTAFPVFFALLVLTVLCSGGVLAGDTTQLQAAQQPLADEQTEFVVDIGAEGDAEWQVTERFTVRDGDESAFREFAQSFEAGEQESRFVETLQRVAERLDGELNRSISTTAPQRTATLEDGEGSLTVSLTWQNFSRVDGDDLSVDDVLTVGGETWFEGLEKNQTLSVVPPEGFGVEDANAPIQAGRLRWEGPTTFGEDTLEMVFTGDSGNNGGPPDSGEDDPGDGGNSNDQSNLLWLLGGALIVAIIAALVFLYREQADQTTPAEASAGADEPVEQDTSSSTTDDTADATAATISSADESTDGAGAEVATTEGVGADSADGTATESDSVGAEDDTDSLDEELLSDEERVERLLESNGGRMKQAAIVDETDWSNAKVSQLLSSMEENDRIDKLRIGRENLISFPDVDITGSNDED